MKNWINLIVCLLAPLTVGGISGYFTSSNIASWYTTLIKPSFNPPNYLFGPVWTTLYILMGISFFLVLKKSNSKEKRKNTIVFTIQLLLNFLWSFIFFEFHLLGIAFIEILIMWIAIFVMILQFYKTNKLAALINIPYLLWVSFASVLNYSIYNLNI